MLYPARAPDQILIYGSMTPLRVALVILTAALFWLFASAVASATDPASSSNTSASSTAAVPSNSGSGSVDSAAKTKDASDGEDADDEPYGFGDFGGNHGCPRENQADAIM